MAAGEIGDLLWFRGEHTEDFDADGTRPATWRNFGAANGTMGDLAPHMINAALALAGPIARLSADIGTVYPNRPGAEGRAVNDDIGQFMCRFANGAMGHLSFSRVAQGRKMGYAYEITGTKGAIRFDQEDQNALWLYKARTRRRSGVPQDPDRAFASRLSAVLPGAGAWHRLPGPDHHRGQGFSDRHRHGPFALANLPRRDGSEPHHRGGPGLGGLGRLGGPMKGQP